MILYFYNLSVNNGWCLLSDLEILVVSNFSIYRLIGSRFSSQTTHYARLKCHSRVVMIRLEDYI